MRPDTCRHCWSGLHVLAHPRQVRRAWTVSGQLTSSLGWARLALWASQQLGNGLRPLPN